MDPGWFGKTICFKEFHESNNWLTQVNHDNSYQIVIQSIHTTLYLVQKKLFVTLTLILFLNSQVSAMYNFVFSASYSLMWLKTPCKCFYLLTYTTSPAYKHMNTTNHDDFDVSLSVLQSAWHRSQAWHRPLKATKPRLLSLVWVVKEMKVFHCLISIAQSSNVNNHTTLIICCLDDVHILSALTRLKTERNGIKIPPLTVPKFPHRRSDKPVDYTYGYDHHYHIWAS